MVNTGRITCLAVLAAFALTNCGGNKQAIPIAQEQAEVSNQGIVVADAYLFDCKLKRDGKTNSFRLELFVTDSIAAFSGRGYLGKGVLQGVLRADSIFAAFPTTHEYVAEDIRSLLRSNKCTSEFSDTVVLGLLQPISELSLENKDAKIDDFSLSPATDSCPTRLTFSYKKKNKFWRPNKIEFSDGKGTQLTAVCREVKEHAKIPVRRFQFTVPEAGIRIFP